MVKIKPKVEINESKDFLESLNFTVDSIEEIKDGQIAKTYLFNSNGRKFFIQFNQENMSQGVINELLFRDEFSKNSIPLRNIAGYGDYKEYKYLITESVEGKSFDKLNEKEFIESLPEVISMLKRVSESDISNIPNYGWLDERGNGKFDSWISHLEFLKEEEPGWFYGEWHKLFETTFMERDKFDSYFGKMTQLFEYLPQKRKLIHSGYCGGNIIFKEGKIVALLDWQDARIGDPVYDLAYMIFWMEKDRAQLTINEYIKTFNLDPDKEHLLERIRCYHYYIGLDGMRFAAKTGNQEFYNYIMWLLSEV